LKAVVLVGGSAVPPELLQREIISAELIICADSGAKYLAPSGRLPDVLVGDMDSIDDDLLEQMEAAGVKTLRAVAEKDETDGLLALDQAVMIGATEIVLLGALGGRVDHLLGNLMLLVRAAQKGVKAVIADDSCEIMAATGATVIAGKAGETVSLLPIGTGVSVCYLDGMRYGTVEPLPLPIDSPVGVSNELTADVAHVVINGWAYIIRNYSVQVQNK
jgi:thiamine pyrophosphokinase